ncbi:MAG: RluA family pseudouridine synthase [Eubacteriales bacterium]
MISNSKLQILFEDAHIIVCKKPAGIATQSKSTRGLDMESLIKRHIYQTSKIKQEPYLAVIHRLDQPVSGVLVFAKTPAAAKSLNQQLTSHGFGKHYIALLTKTPPPEYEGKPLINYLKKNNQTNSSHVSEKNDPLSKKAILQYTILSNPTSMEWSLFTHCEIPEAETVVPVAITLDTGRHHQIRVQMAHLGCPIWGDSKYGSTAESWTNIALCAYRLAFHHPATKKRLEFYAYDC